MVAIIVDKSGYYHQSNACNTIFLFSHFINFASKYRFKIYCQCFKNLLYFFKKIFDYLHNIVDYFCSDSYNTV